MTGEATDLVALKRLAEEATPGPWEADISSARNYVSVRRTTGPGTRTGKTALLRLQTTLRSQRAAEAIADAAFIAAANPATILSLATLIEAQAAEIEGLKMAVEDLKGIREEAFRGGWRKGFTGAMNSGPLPDEDSDYLSYAKPTLTIVGE